MSWQSNTCDSNIEAAHMVRKKKELEHQEHQQLEITYACYRRSEGSEGYDPNIITLV